MINSGFMVNGGYPVSKHSKLSLTSMCAEPLNDWIPSKKHCCMLGARNPLLIAPRKENVEENL